MNGCGPGALREDLPLGRAGPWERGKRGRGGSPATRVSPRASGDANRDGVRACSLADGSAAAARRLVARNRSGTARGTLVRGGHDRITRGGGGPPDGR